MGGKNTQARDEDTQVSGEEEQAGAAAETTSPQACADAAEPQGAQAQETSAPQAEVGEEPGEALDDGGEDRDVEQDVDSLRAALEASQATVASLEDRLLRSAAEVENVRKRSERGVASARKFALERFVADLLPAVDSFERASEAGSADKGQSAPAQAAITEGVELSLKLLLEAMNRQGVVVIDPLGEPFDPTEHEAMSMIEAPAAEPGSVIEVFQKGYSLNGRLVRPARVIVAKAPAESEEAEPAREAEAEGGAREPGTSASTSPPESAEES